MNDYGIEAGARPPCHKSEARAAKDGCQCLDFWFPQMQQGERDSLDENGRTWADDSGKSEQEKAPPQELPWQNEQERCPKHGKMRRCLKGWVIVSWNDRGACRCSLIKDMSVVIIHGGSSNEKPEDDRHNRAYEDCPNDSLFHVSQAQPVVRGSVAKEDKYYKERSKEEQKQLIISVVRGEKAFPGM